MQNSGFAGSGVAAARAGRHQRKDHHIRHEAEPEDHLTHLVMAEHGSRHRGHHHAHIGDEIRGEHLMQLEIQDIAVREPHHEQEMAEDRPVPDHLAHRGRIWRRIGAELHDRHKERRKHTGKNRIPVQIIFHHAGMHDDLRKQQHPQKRRADPADIFQKQRIRGEQIAQRRQPQHDTRCGDRNFSEHNTSFLTMMIFSRNKFNTTTGIPRP